MKFMYVPSHIGIEGNEKLDEPAKSAELLLPSPSKSWQHKKYSSKPNLQHDKT